MLRSGHHRLRAAGLAAAVTGAAAFGATPAAAAPKPTLPPLPKPATVVSVDGPALLTVRMGRRTLPLRLVGADAPRAATKGDPGECGAAESAAALGRMAKPGGKVMVDLVRTLQISGRGAAVRDGARRLYAGVSPPFGESFTSRLLAQGWARQGTAVGPGGLVEASNGPAGKSAVTSRATWAALTDDDGPVGGDGTRGLWKLCGGRFHLPAGSPAPSFSPYAWSVSSAGVVTKIGPWPIPRGPWASAPAMDRVMRDLGSTEVSVIGGYCNGWVPERGLLVLGMAPAAGSNDAPDCSQAKLVGFITTHHRVPVGSGLLTGSAPAPFKAAFPSGVTHRLKTFNGVEIGSNYELGPSTSRSRITDLPLDPLGLVSASIGRKSGNIEVLTAITSATEGAG